MNEQLEIYLAAWGAVKRADHRELKRVNYAQARYEEVTTGGALAGRCADDFVLVIDQAGRSHKVELTVVDLCHRLICALGDQHEKILNTHYLYPGNSEEKGQRCGISRATYTRRVRDAKVAFGIRYMGETRGVIQRGVQMKFDVAGLTA